MPDIIIDLLKGDRIGDETDYRDALPINMSGILRPIFGVAGYLWQQPGLTQYSTGSGIDRGGIWNERFKRHYRVSGQELIQVDTDGTVTILGAIPGTDTVSLPYSFNTQGIVADGKFYLYDDTNGLREVTDPDLGDPIDGVWVDGYYFFTNGESLYHTELSDESSLDPTDFSVSQFSPDPSIAVDLTPDDKVIVFNRYSIEYFVNDATSAFAFTRVSTRTVKAGIVGTHCQVEMLDRFYIVGGRKTEDVAVHVVGIGSIEKISSREVDKLINAYTEDELSTVVLEARVEKDYQFLILHLENETLLYNARVAKAVGHEKAWTILKTDVIGDVPWRAKHGVFETSRAQWVYGDKIDSTIGYLDETINTQYGEVVEWVLYTPFMYLESMSIDMLEIETIPGFTDFTDARVFLSFTTDGVTYGNTHLIDYGDPAEYGTRFIVNRPYGYVRDWIGMKLRGATPARMAFSRGFISYG